MDDISTRYKIREASVDDIGAIVAINEQWEGKDMMFGDSVEKMISDSKCMMLVAEFDGKVVGYAGGVIREYEFGEKEAIGYITHVGLSKEFISKGMGHILGDQLVEKMEPNCSKIRTILSFERKDLQTFFNNLGFQRTDLLVYEYIEG